MFSPGCKGGRIYSASTIIYFGLRLPGKGNSLTPKELVEQRKASGRGWRWKPASQSLWDSERYRHTLPASPLSNLQPRLLWWPDSSVGIRDVNCPLCISLITHFYFTNTSIYDSLDLEKQKNPWDITYCLRSTALVAPDPDLGSQSWRLSIEDFGLFSLVTAPKQVGHRTRASLIWKELRMILSSFRDGCWAHPKRLMHILTCLIGTQNFRCAVLPTLLTSQWGTEAQRESWPTWGASVRAEELTVDELVYQMPPKAHGSSDHGTRKGHWLQAFLLKSQDARVPDSATISVVTFTGMGGGKGSLSATVYLESIPPGFLQPCNSSYLKANFQYSENFFFIKFSHVSVSAKTPTYTLHTQFHLSLFLYSRLYLHFCLKTIVKQLLLPE